MLSILLDLLKQLVVKGWHKTFILWGVNTPHRWIAMSTLGRVKTAFTRADRGESDPYECKSCGARFRLQRQVCPECGGYTFDRVEWSSSNTLEKGWE